MDVLNVLAILLAVETVALELVVEHTDLLAQLWPCCKLLLWFIRFAERTANFCAHALTLEPHLRLHDVLCEAVLVRSPDELSSFSLQTFLFALFRELEDFLAVGIDLCFHLDVVVSCVIVIHN